MTTSTLKSKARAARLFRQHRRRWISALAVAKATGLLSHSQRISDLREDGWQIENKTITVKGVRQSYYRYAGKQKAA